MEILILLSVLLIVFVFVTDNVRKYNPILIFNGIWLIIYVLFELNLLDFIAIDAQSVVILAVMQIAFTIGGIIGQRYLFRFELSSKNKIRYTCDYNLRSKIFFGLCAVAIIVMLVDEIQIIISLLRGASFQSIMREAEGKETVVISNGIQAFLYIFVVYPVSYMVSPVCAVEFFKRENKRAWYLAVNLAIVALSVVHHGGRNAIFQMIISYGIVFLVLGKGANLKKRTKVLLAAGLVLSFVLINGISESRGIENAGESFYAYFTCSVPLMQKYLQSDIIADKPLWGFYSFNGFIQPIMIILGYFKISLPGIYTTTQSFRNFVENSYVSIGGYSHNMNAFMPAGAYFYVDGGYIFEFIGMFFYGLFSGNLFRRVKNADLRNSRNLSMFAFIVIGLLLSFTKFWFTTYGCALALVYIVLLYGKTKIRPANSNV